MIIGLTGKNCAGKTTIAEYLVRKGFVYLSLSDVIRDALTTDSKEFTRENMIDKGNALRAAHGPGYIASKTMEKFQPGKNYVIDSIRNPNEVAELKTLDSFILINVISDDKTRFERMKNRMRPGDPSTFEEFMRYEQLEAGSDNVNAQQMDETCRMAHESIRNNDIIEELYNDIDLLLRRLLKKIKSKRPSWDEYFMNIAKVVASRSNCMKRHVAAVIVKDGRIISTGYNGTPRKTRNCDEGGCPRCNSFAESGTKLEECLCSHGEENAIVQASYHGISIKESVIYTTFSPCLICTKMIINAGIAEVVFNSKYPMSELSIALLTEAGVKVREVRVD
ncbi:TPA: AAA family ATPase [Candidatus Micrarchaeota archaeon]|nr:AAA family ATPase [Candidatus Micrarchaeota archaeon]